MSLPIYVDAYAGYKPTERPQQFVLDEEISAIAAVLDQGGHVELLLSRSGPKLQPEKSRFQVRSIGGCVNTTHLAFS
jgi:hypothetical protein